jgi:hypothetical protein
VEIETYEQDHARRVLIGMVTNPVFCARIASQWKPPGLFDSDWANQIGTWCVRYCLEYNKAPNTAIEPLMAEWVERANPKQEVVDAVESFLVGLSDEMERMGDLETGYLLDIAGRYFNKVKMTAVLEAATADLSYGDVEKAKGRIEGLRPVELAQGSYCEPSNDFSVWTKAFSTEERRSLVMYPGAVGRFFDGAWLRGELYSFMAPEKTGKTEWLIDFTVRALRCKNRVAFFDSGDSSIDEILMRLGKRLSFTSEYGGTVSVPVEWPDEDDLPRWEDRVVAATDPVRSYEMMGVVSRNRKAFRLASYPNSTLSVSQLSATLDDWGRDDWRPDVVVVDYADILLPPSGFSDGLEKIDEMWKALRRLSQEKNILVVTATQADAASYTQKGLLGKQNFSGRKTKLSHVNGMIGINVSEDDRNRHMAKLNWIARRRNVHQRSRNWVSVAGNYVMGNPIILSK